MARIARVVMPGMPHGVTQRVLVLDLGDEDFIVRLEREADRILRKQKS